MSSSKGPSPKWLVDLISPGCRLSYEPKFEKHLAAILEFFFWQQLPVPTNLAESFPTQPISSQSYHQKLVSSFGLSLLKAQVGEFLLCDILRTKAANDSKRLATPTKFAESFPTQPFWSQYYHQKVSTFTVQMLDPPPNPLDWDI